MWVFFKDLAVVKFRKELLTLSVQVYVLTAKCLAPKRLLFQLTSSFYVLGFMLVIKKTKIKTQQKVSKINLGETEKHFIEVRSEYRNH